LETALQATPGSSAAVEAKNQIRASIKDLFPDRDCFTLVGGCGVLGGPWADNGRLHAVGAAGGDGSHLFNTVGRGGHFTTRASVHMHESP